MDHIKAAALFDELEKIAGVGIDIHGYTRDPDKPSKSFLRSLEKKTGYSPDEDPEWAKDVWRDQNTAKTPYDRDSSYGYKAHLNVLRGQSPYDLKPVTAESGIWKSKATDQAYSSKPKVHNLSRRDVRKLVSEYRSNSGAVAVPERDRAMYTKVNKAFINKAQSLLRDKHVKVMRLEYE